MKIEIGKEYRISPSRKKCFSSQETYENSDIDNKIVISSVWRGGSYIVKINSEEEKELLEEYMTETNGEMEPDEFEENEMVSYYDETYSEIDVYLSEDSHQEYTKEEIIELIEKEGHEWLDEMDYDCIECEHYLGLPLEVTEVNESNRYNL